MFVCGASVPQSPHCDWVDRVVVPLQCVDDCKQSKARGKGEKQERHADKRPTCYLPKKKPYLKSDRAKEVDSLIFIKEKTCD